MKNAVETLVNDFEKGRISRRDLVGKLCAVSMLAAGASHAAHHEKSSFRASGVNHIALNTPDVALSRDFYVKHLGMKVAREGASNCFLTCDDNFLALFRAPDAGLNHFCFSVDDYDVEKAEARLTEEGLEPRRTGNRIYFKDPHGLTVQLSADKHMP